MWITRVFANVAFALVWYHVSTSSVNFGIEDKSATFSDKEFQILGPNLLKLLSPNVVAFYLLTL